MPCPFPLSTSLPVRSTVLRTGACPTPVLFDLAGLVDEQDGNPVANGVGETALVADELTGFLVQPQRSFALRADQDFQQPFVDLGAHRSLPPVVGCARCSGQARMIARTSSRSSAMDSVSGASTLSRSSGSVLDARRLNQRFPVRFTVRPSRWSTLSTSARPVNASSTAAMRPAWSATRELISPEATYRVYSAVISDSGRWSVPSTRSTCIAASMPVSAFQKSRK